MTILSHTTKWSSRPLQLNLSWNPWLSSGYTDVPPIPSYEICAWRSPWPLPKSPLCAVTDLGYYSGCFSLFGLPVRPVFSSFLYLTSTNHSHLELPRRPRFCQSDSICRPEGVFRPERLRIKYLNDFYNNTIIVNSNYLLCTNNSVVFLVFFLFHEKIFDHMW